MKHLASIGTVLAALCLWAPARADQLTTPADAGSVGFSPAGLARIAPWYQARFDAFPPSEGLVPGAVVAIAKGGRLAYLQPIGFQDRAKTVPMKVNSIFWIASMTKPVTTVAAMILVDDGKLDLDAPVARYLPEIGNMRVVALDPATGKAGLELQKRPMTVRDLLRHTSGVIYPEMDFAFPERGLADANIESALRAIHMIYGWRVVFRRDKTLADFVSSLASLPLVHQPGEVHEYGWSADVLARVVEVASGQPLDQFMQTRIFAPLQMVDTGFFVPKEKLDRLVDSPMPERPPIWDLATPPKLFSGGGGLASTAPDYVRFCQMLLNGGELDGVRVLSPQAVTQMTTNALPPDVRIFGGDEVGGRAGTTFGLGFGIRTSPIASWIPGAPGSFGWAGYWGTFFWVDPAEQMIGVEMIQATPGSKARRALGVTGITHLTYSALAVAAPSADAPPAAAPNPSAEALADYVGTYDFARSVSARDRQGVADGKNGWLGIEAFVAMEQEGLRINRPDPGSPAIKAGIITGDLVTELDGVPLKNLTLADVLARLRGPADTPVKLKVVRHGQDSDLTIVRTAYRANTVQLQVRLAREGLVAEAVGVWPILAFEKGKAVPLVAASNNEFSVADDDHTRIAFVRDSAGKVSGLVLDPGPWELRAAMLAANPK